MNEDLDVLGFCFNLVRRTPESLDITIKSRSDTNSWNVYVADTLEAAYNAQTGSGLTGAPVNIFTVPSNGYFRSTTIKAKGWGLFNEPNKGLTRALFDISDFAAAGVPTDSKIGFYRLSVNRPAEVVIAGAVDTGNPYLGPIYVVPPPQFFGTSYAALSLEGLAPASTGCTGGSNPLFDLSMQTPLPLHIVLPETSRGGTLDNLDGTEDLLYSVGAGLPMATLPAGHSIELHGSFKELVLSAAAGTAVPFALAANLHGGKHNN